jgi:hypothetical protein
MPKGADGRVLPITLPPLGATNKVAPLGAASNEFAPLPALVRKHSLSHRPLLSPAKKKVRSEQDANCLSRWTTSWLWGVILRAHKLANETPRLSLDKDDMPALLPSEEPEILHANLIRNWNTLSAQNYNERSHESLLKAFWLTIRWKFLGAVSRPCTSCSVLSAVTFFVSV